MQPPDHPLPGTLPHATAMIGGAGAAVVILHASHLGPFAGDALRLAVVAMSAAAGRACSLAHGRLGLALSVLTLLLYWLFLYPLELLPPRPSLFHAFYGAVAAGALALTPAMLLRRRYGLAGGSVAAGVVLLWYVLI